MMITVTAITALMKVHWSSNTGAVFTYSSGSCLWFFLMVYSVTTIMFCFMLSVCFSRASTAAAVAGLVWFISYTPYFFLEQHYESVATSVKIVFCLFGNTALGLGLNVILRYEAEQEGIQWGNVFTPMNSNVSFHLGHVITMLIVDALLYLVVALYVEKIKPGAYGLAEKWNFPFTSDFWCENVPIKAEKYSGKSSNDEEKTEKVVGVKVDKLRKVFDEKVAVESLDLELYEGQITVLLGHNGSGKTTTISMLSGIIPPTSGSVTIDGKSILKSRGLIGFCPQHDILFGKVSNIYE